MRVKLSYTAEVKDVLQEGAYLLSNKGESLKECISLFNEVITTLQEGKYSSNDLYTTITKLRGHLGDLDIRLLEVQQIVMGLEHYNLQERQPLPTQDEVKEAGDSDD
jgi:hypothetical protein